MGSREKMMKNVLVSDNYWNYFLLIASIILLRQTPGLQKNIPLPDEVNDGNNVSTRYDIHFTGYVYNYAQVRNISDLTLNVSSLSASTLVIYTLGLQHTSEK